MFDTDLSHVSSWRGSGKSWHSSLESKEHREEKEEPEAESVATSAGVWCAGVLVFSAAEAVWLRKKEVY